MSGAIVRWHLVDAAGEFSLRTLRPAGGTAYASTGTSAVVTPAGTGLETFVTALPILAGEAIGLDVPEGSRPGIDGTTAGNTAADWDPALGEGATAPYTSSAHGEYAFDAEVQPEPTISAISPATGLIGTPVTISGTDFEGATAVSFGTVPAPSFTVDSEGSITAVAPAGAGAVQISVETVAGTATSTRPFDYPPPVATPTPISTPAPSCIVPRLKGRKLKASKKRIRASDCKVGEVTRRKGARPATGLVVGQSEKPGTVLPAGSAVRVTLGKG